MESKTLQKSQSVNIFLTIKHKGNPPVTDQWRDVIYWVQGHLPMMKVGLGCKVGQQLHVILRFTCKGMSDMKIQEF
jgi:hypothetical protein